MLGASYSTNWWLFIYFYAVQFPLGIGLVYFTPIICSWEWFPDNKGLVGGLILSGYGFGAFVFGFISTAIVNPDDEAVELPGDGDQDKLFP